MKKNDFLCLNNIIWQIYNEPDFYLMQQCVLDLLATVIPYTFASFMTAEAGSDQVRLSHPVCRPAGMAVEQIYMGMQEQDYGRWLMFGGKSMIVRASDMLPEEERIQTPFYQKCCAPFGLHYLLDLSLVEKGVCVGILSLYRQRQLGDFDADEMFVAQALSEHLNSRFYQEYAEAEAEAAPEESRDAVPALARQYRLTSRETQVLAALLEGGDGPDICRELCISDNTLKKHLQNIYRKCRVSGRLELLRLAND